jgi:hypothetical protein
MKIPKTGICLTIGLLCLAGYSQTWTNGLIAYYPFSGSAEDHSGLGNHGTAVGSVTLTNNRFGDINSACYFYGGYVNATVPQLPLGGAPRTLTAWIRPEMTTVIWGSIMYGNGDCQGKMFGLSRQPNGQVGLWGGCQDWSAPLYATNSMWSFVAIVYENGTIRIFKNGAWASVTGGALATTMSRLWIGVESVFDNSYFRYTFRGTIDDVRLYNRALSTNEVKSLYASEVTKPQPVVQLVQAITVDGANLTVGSNYQIQVSTDLINWSNWGNPFTATSATYTNTTFERMPGWGQSYFRLLSQ